MQLLLIDNYDSFVWNLSGLFRELGATVKVVRNDEIAEIETLWPKSDALIISPGPGKPKESGYCPTLLGKLPRNKPVLGICLGHQLIVEHFGGVVNTGLLPMHGKVSEIQHIGTGIFSNLPQPLPVMRYHSLVSSLDSLPSCLIPHAWTPNQELMATFHLKRPIWGLQFHPESILTPQGPLMLKQWLAEIAAVI